MAEQNLIRLTCPLCGDSGVFSAAELETLGGGVDCGNHVEFSRMVTEDELEEILAVLGGLLDFHPDDLEDWSMEGRSADYHQTTVE